MFGRPRVSAGPVAVTVLCRAGVQCDGSNAGPSMLRHLAREGQCWNCSTHDLNSTIGFDDIKPAVLTLCRPGRGGAQTVLRVAGSNVVPIGASYVEQYIEKAIQTTVHVYVLADALGLATLSMHQVLIYSIKLQQTLCVWH